jgi:RNA polymerase sigma-70 factor (ECF subfamily)
MELLTTNETSDQSLVRQCLAGDRGAFTGLMNRHLGKVRGVIHNMVLNPADTDDLAQETFLAAYRSLGSYRGGSAFSTWLCAIAVNKACSHVRKQSRGRRALERMDTGDVWSRHPDADMLEQEARQEIDAAIEQLPAHLRAVLVLSVVEGHSGAEVAEICACSTAAVYWRLHQARKQLQKTMGGETRESFCGRTAS